MILKKPDERTLLALRRLRGDSDFMELQVWMQSCMHDIDAKLRTLPDDTLLRQHQGAAQVLSEIVQYAEQGIVPAIAKREARTG